MRASASHNRDEIFARRFFLVLSHFDLTLSQHRGILFFFFSFYGVRSNVYRGVENVRGYGTQEVALASITDVSSLVSSLY